MADWLLGYTILILAIAFGGYALNILREKKIAWPLSRPRLARCPKCRHVCMIERFTLNPHCPNCNARTTNFITQN